MDSYGPAAGSNATARMRFFPETGQNVRQPFLDYIERHGTDVCGYPITGELIEEGRRVQYFEHLALEENAPGDVRPRPLGYEVLDLRERLRRARGEGVAIPPPRVSYVVPHLPAHATDRYLARPLNQIQYLIIHHTAAPPSVSPLDIAHYHIDQLKWPGIGYHYVVDVDGRIYQTNDLTTESFHARHLNPYSVGIALAGNLSEQAPPPVQLDAAAHLCAWLLDSLHLPTTALAGHGDLVPTACPGDRWNGDGGWKAVLLDEVRNLLQPRSP